MDDRPSTVKNNIEITFGQARSRAIVVVRDPSNSNQLYHHTQLFSNQICRRKVIQNHFKTMTKRDYKPVPYLAIFKILSLGSL